MKKIKVSEASGPVLDWMVAKCEGITPYAFVEHDHGQGAHRALGRWCGIHVSPSGHTVFAPSTNWSQGGPIIEREVIGLEAPNCERGWVAQIGMNYEQEGSTPLIAAMRCFVASKLGDEVEVPEELL